MNILITEPDDYSIPAIEIYREIGNVKTSPAFSELTDRDVQGANVLVIRLKHFISRQLIEKAPQLKYIVSTTTGTDHIDEAFASKQGIKLLSLNGETNFLETIPSAAEFTWALLLALSKRIVPAINDVKEGNWDRLKFRGVNVKGKRLGILGLGRIGKQITRVAQAFEMKDSAFDPYQKEWIDGVEKKQTPEELFQDADFLTILIPAANNKKFVSAELLQKTKKGAAVINTSRGSVWDERAVIELLLSSHLSGVATDVITYETEPLKRLQSPILAYNGKLDNLIVTPHLGGATLESMQAAELYLAKKLLQTFRSSQ